jgi:salicylate 5-hydroxylase large subunit
MTEHPIHWETPGTSRVPFAVYTDEDRHKKELERFFYKGHWSYVGLEAEIPNVGDFKRTVVGERSVIMTRSEGGQIHVVENVCAHRGMQFCRERHGNKKEFVCPYHQWSYTLQGDLQGVPFRRGVRQDGKVNGGMPADFDPKDHGLTALKVATRGGVVFASFDHNVESLEDFMGPTILKYFDRLFNGRKLVVLGYNRQRIPGNWKLMQENIKDPYHPGLRQSNLFGPAGFVSADDGEVIEFSQQAFETKPEHRMLVELGGRDVGETDHMVTETLIRGMYEYWRKVMEA